MRADPWREALPESAWATVAVRDGDKRPWAVEAVKCRVRALTPTKGTGPEELLRVARERLHDGTFKHDDFLSNADPGTPLAELARVTRSAHRIEECFHRAKSEAGLADYQVRTWPAWHRHQILALLAAWFLNRETGLWKNPDRRSDLAPTPAVARRLVPGASEGQPVGRAKLPKYSQAETQRAGQVLTRPLT